MKMLRVSCSSLAALVTTILLVFCSYTTCLLQSNIESASTNNETPHAAILPPSRNYHHARSNASNFAGLERLAQILARRSPPTLSNTTTTSPTAPPVNIAVYYETLCPYCQAFITKQLYPLYKTLGSDIVNVTFVPYGNAREIAAFGRNEYVCQHGIQECIGNNIQGCVLNSGLNNADLLMAFINCLESSPHLPSESVQRCGVSVGIDYSKVERCAYDYHQYAQIMHEYALVTSAAQPKLQGVPYVQVDGKYEPDATDNLLSFVCNAYQGSKPAACNATAIQRAAAQQQVLLRARTNATTLLLC